MAVDRCGGLLPFFLIIPLHHVLQARVAEIKPTHLSMAMPACMQGKVRHANVRVHVHAYAHARVSMPAVDRSGYTRADVSPGMSLKMHFLGTSLQPSEHVCSCVDMSTDMYIVHRMLAYLTLQSTTV